jgi:hypothetical protein
VSLVQLRLARLTLVKMTPLFKYHKKTFILIGVLICQISCDTLIPLFVNATYIVLTENLSDERSAQTKCLFPLVSTHHVTTRQFYTNPLNSYQLDCGERKYLEVLMLVLLLSSLVFSSRC